MFYQEIGKEFLEELEEMVMNNGSYIDSILALCEKFNIEPQVAAKIITRPIREKIEKEGRDSNLLPTVSSLPV